MRGVSTTYGTTSTATTTSATSTATRPSRIFTQRMAAAPLRSGGLDGRQRPGVGADGARERPELLEALGTAARAGHHRAARVERVVDEAARQQHCHEVLTTLLPGLRHLGALDLDTLDAVDAALAAQAIALRLQVREHL